VFLQPWLALAREEVQEVTVTAVVIKSTRIKIKRFIFVVFKVDE
jgi:hypothetical protein